MAIKTNCPSCGQGYTLADSQEGKRVRCKSCSEPFEVWAPGPPDRAEAPARRRPRDEEDDRYADRPSRRRGRDDYGEEEPPARRRGRPDDYEGEEDYDERPRARRRTGGGIPLWVWLVGGGGVAVLLLGVVLAIVLIAGGPNITEENYKKLKVNQTTEAQAREILGRPTEASDTKERGKLIGLNIDMGKVLVWKSGNNEVTAIFQNDKLSMKVGKIGDKAFLGDNSIGVGDLKFNK